MAFVRMLESLYFIGYVGDYVARYSPDTHALVALREEKTMLACYVSQVSVHWRGGHVKLLSLSLQGASHLGFY